MLSKILAYIWLAASIVLIMKTLPEAITTTWHNGFIADLIGLSFSSVVVISSVGLLLKQKWASVTLKILSWVVILYLFMYLGLGGEDDTGPIYLCVVLGMSLLSVFSLIILRGPRLVK